MNLCPLTRLSLTPLSPQDDSSEYSLDYEELFEDYTTPLDSADCPVDEFVVFRETLEGLQRAQPEWYGALTAPLSEDDRKHLQEAFTMAEQRKAARHAENIKKQGGEWSMCDTAMYG